MRILLRLAAATFPLLACASAQPAPATSSAIPEVAGERHRYGGVEYVEITEGAGSPAALQKCLFVHYTGWLENGRKIDSSRDLLPSGTPMDPVSFVLGNKRVLPGWEAGVRGMMVGGKRRLFIPYQLAYGTAGSPPTIPERAPLVFDVELMAVTEEASRQVCPAWSAVRR